jgi:hypothetical protein
MTETSQHTVAGCFSDGFGRVYQLGLTGGLGGKATTPGDATAGIIEDSTEIALGIPYVRIGDTEIGCNIGFDAIEGRNGRNRPDGDDEDTEQSRELHLENNRGKKVIYRELVVY